jgi:hypothetical protein
LLDEEVIEGARPEGNDSVCEGRSTLVAIAECSPANVQRTLTSVRPKRAINNTTTTLVL